MNQLNDTPLIVTFDSKLTDEELDTLININGYEQSFGYDHSTQQKIISEHRKSLTFMDLKDDFRNIRLKLLVQISLNTGYHHDLNFAEPLQLTKYLPDEFYKSHRDNFNYEGEKFIDNDRIATLILYLNDDFTGGETYFNDFDIKIKPVKGMCCYFLYADKESIEKSSHEAMTVIEGEKKVAQMWIRTNTWAEYR